MVVIGHWNKFCHVRQVKLISILENERAVLIEYSFHWQWWDIFPLLMSGADHLRVGILSCPLPASSVWSPPAEKTAQVQSERCTKIELWRPRLVEGALQGTGCTTALPGVVTVTQESDMGLKNHWLLHWITYALFLVQKRVGSTIRGSLSHRREVCGTGQPPLSSLSHTGSWPQHPSPWIPRGARIPIQRFRHLEYKKSASIPLSLWSLPSNIQGNIMGPLKVSQRVRRGWWF